MNQTLNIYQTCESSQLDRSQPTPAWVSKEKNMTIAFSAWSQNFISSFRLPSLPHQHRSEQVCRQHLAFRRENQLAIQMEWVAAWEWSSTPGVEPSLSEAFQLSLKGLSLEIRRKKPNFTCSGVKLIKAITAITAILLYPTQLSKTKTTNGG